MSKNLNSGTQAKTSPVEVEAKHSGSFGGRINFDYLIPFLSLVFVLYVWAVIMRIFKLYKFSCKHTKAWEKRADKA